MLLLLRLLFLLVILFIPADRIIAQAKPSTTSKKAMEAYNHAIAGLFSAKFRYG